MPPYMQSSPGPNNGPANQNYPQQMPPPGPSYNQSKKGGIGLILTIVILILLLIGISYFAYTSYTKMLDYKNNVDPKINAAVEAAKKETEEKKDKEFIEKEKNPLRNYKSSDVLGLVNIDYPKTWSAYIVEDQSVSSNKPIEGFLHPSFVPGKDVGVAFALRMELTNRQYSDELKQYDGKVKQGTVKVQPYSAPKVPSVVGVKITGEIERGKQSTMVMLPIREKTLRIYTESPQFLGDLENIILPSLSFAP
jgi:hypothetical protein